MGLLLLSLLYSDLLRPRGCGASRRPDRLLSTSAISCTSCCRSVAEISASTDVWHDVDPRLTFDDVHAALNALPLEQKVAIELSYFEGLTCTEIA